MDKSITGVCIIHATDDDPHEGLTSPRDINSWNTLLRAAKLREHLPIISAAENLRQGEIPQIHYHLKCRKLFTMKRDLDKLEDRNVDIADAKRRSLRSLPPSNSRVLEKTCIFCPSGRSKYIKGTRTREILTLCSDLRADNTLRDIATKRQDKHILAVMSRDTVTAKACYHRPCYRSYIKKKNRDNVNDDRKCDECDDPDVQYKKAETEPCMHLFQYIKKEQSCHIDFSCSYAINLHV